jgi:hypothetical protein
MQSLLVVVLGMSLSTSVLADTPVSEEEAQKIKAALDSWGCSGGKMEKQTKRKGVVYEIEDARCKDATYEIQLDKDFKVISIERD